MQNPRINEEGLKGKKVGAWLCGKDYLTGAMSSHPESSQLLEMPEGASQESNTPQWLLFFLVYCPSLSGNIDTMRISSRPS